MKSPVIELRQVNKVYDDGPQPFAALKDVDAVFYPGEMVVIIGKSGSGKTTLVNMISGIDHLTSGEVIFRNKAVQNLSENEAALWRGQNLGIVYQFSQLLPSVSLLDNVLLPMDFCGLYRRPESINRALSLLESVELEDHVFKLPSAISGGQQQRVAIARALANDPPVILADEPTGSLDSLTAAKIIDIFFALVQQGKTVIIVTHDKTLTERASRRIYLSNGEIVQNESEL
ncbi:MAG: ABC transporter ATP-binding protein [Anaerolineae bacterium]|nr:ABC transporter ATP-binding protein [Anaerolineae bacterium]